MLTIFNGFLPQIFPRKEHDSRSSTTEVKGNVDVVIQKVGIPHIIYIPENNNPVLTRMTISIPETKKAPTSEMTAAVASSSSKTKQQKMFTQAILLSGRAILVDLNEEDSISVVHKKVLESVRVTKNDSDFMLCSINIIAYGKLLMDIGYSSCGEFEMQKLERVVCLATKFSDLFPEMEKFPELQDDAKDGKLKFYLAKANRLIENAMRGEIVNSEELVAVIQELEKFQLKYNHLKDKHENEYYRLKKEHAAEYNRFSKKCEARNYAEALKHATYRVYSHIKSTLFHFKEVEGKLSSLLSTSTSLPESKQPVFTAEAAQGVLFPSGRPLKKAGMRRVMVIIFKKNASEYGNEIEKITSFLTNPESFGINRPLGPLLKKPIISKKGPEVLNIFYQKGLYDSVLEDFLKKHLSSVKANVLSKTVRFVNESCAIRSLDYRPHIKTKLATMEVDKPRLILQEILSAPSIKYLILTGTEGARALLEINKASFAPNGYEIIAIESRAPQSSIDAQHFLEAKADVADVLGPHDERASIISELTQSGLRLVALNEHDIRFHFEEGIDDTEFALATALTINHEVTIRSEKRFPLSNNPKGRGKVIIWVDPNNNNISPDDISKVAQHFKRSETMMIEALESSNIGKESCMLDSSPAHDVTFHFPKGTSKNPNNEAKVTEGV